MTDEKFRGLGFLLQSQYQKLLKRLALNLKPASVLVADLGSSTLGLWHAKLEQLKFRRINF